MLGHFVRPMSLQTRHSVLDAVDLLNQLLDLCFFLAAYFDERYNQMERHFQLISIELTVMFKF